MENPVAIRSVAGVSQGAILSRLSGEEGEPRPVIHVKNIGRLLLDDDLDELELSQREVKRYSATAGQVLLAQTGFHAAVVEERHAQRSPVVGSNITIITPDTNKVDSYYLASLLSSAVMERQLERFTGGGAARSINSSQVEAFQIPLIDLDRQRKIGAAFLAAAQMEAAAAKLAAAQRERLEHFIRDIAEGGAA